MPQIILGIMLSTRSAANFENGEFMAALQDIQAATATKAYPDHLIYKLKLRWMALIFLCKLRVHS